ncbi:leucine--tRNA ligase [candidate division WOR-3 bacterium]|uniref:Leucine--tRNA ligase n=1 Tax=candidate division WOR-3 bacterium TaxID=2052148 RepID=A0A937XEX9_UNCW3|nr:leucine--tRNA ligase [candidate division WOR-3 bacterium]
MRSEKRTDGERTRVAYPAREIEKRWQEFWQEQGTFHTEPDPKRKFYVLVMFFYPSGDVHMGHCRNYVIGDVLCRFRKMQGYDVLHPFGWDAFGLPAENAAIAHGNHPSYWTFESIKTARQSLKLLGIGYDWDREVTTCLPEYYRWNQWLFIKLYERGLAYRKEASVNWCPNCQTVLANEQVKEGVCYRCKATVDKRKLTQWFLKISQYAQELLDGIDKLDRWPENVKTMQRHWIGRSDGVEVDFSLAETGEKVPVFTTRPDTLHGVTFMALAPDSVLAETIARGTTHEKEVEEFRKRINVRPEIERLAATGDKEGVFTGKYAVNPLTGDQVPIYLADFVLASYGTGMVMAVPGHDQRDFEFARKYKIPIKVVIESPKSGVRSPNELTEAYTDVGVMVNSGQFDGTRSDVGMVKVSDYLERAGTGRRVVNFRLKDWLVSRQRYWGTPIPMLHCQDCGVVPVPVEQLPVLLPEDIKDYKPKGKSVLEGVESFINTTCPKCGGPARRDPDTMDTFVDSSWYHLRYTDAHNGQLPFGKNEADKWLPIDEYIGGIEHATGHLIFFRFFTRALHDMGMLAVAEPCLTLHTQGMVSLDGVTMSSSKRVGVWVGEFVPEHGADVGRLAVLFAAPPEKGMDWTEDLVTGVTRFVNRLWRLYEGNAERVRFERPDTGRLTGNELKLYTRLNQTIAKTIADCEGFQFNTAIAAQMEFLNDLSAFTDRESAVYGFALGQLIHLLAPFTPHLAEELWHRSRPDAGSLFGERFPEADAKFLVFDEMVIPVQVDGKVRDRVSVLRTATESEVKEAALASPGIAAFLAGRQVVKVIYVKDRLVNMVLAKEQQ